MRSRSALPPLVLAGAIAVAACGGDDADDAGAATAAPAAEATPALVAEPAVETTGAAAADFNDADVTFAQGMIPHHEQAIEMATIALDPTVDASAEVQDLAGRIEGAQDPEIDLMTEWLTAWGQPIQMDTSDGHDMSAMEGMMTAEEMDALGEASGADFDRLWLEMMIRHHQGAIAMAETVKAEGQNADALALADEIIAAQQAEIDEMQALLDA